VRGGDAFCSGIIVSSMEGLLRTFAIAQWMRTPIHVGNGFSPIHRQQWFLSATAIVGPFQGGNELLFTAVIIVHMHNGDDRSHSRWQLALETRAAGSNTCIGLTFRPIHDSSYRLPFTCLFPTSTMQMKHSQLTRALIFIASRLPIHRSSTLVFNLHHLTKAGRRLGLRIRISTI
jgi:hypothetical protein